MASALPAGYSRRSFPRRAAHPARGGDRDQRHTLDQDQNSAFDQTGFAVHLHKAGILHLIVSGLAEDVCVLATVLDARTEGFAVSVISAGTRPVTPEGGAAARQKMLAAGAELL